MDGMTITRQTIFPVLMDGHDFEFSLQSWDDSVPETSEVYLTVTNCRDHKEAFLKLQKFIQAVKRLEVEFR